MMIKFNKQTDDGKDVFYDILDDGFKIYIGQTSTPTIHQYEPFIPDHTKSYEENAIQMCDELCTPSEPPEPSFAMTEDMYTEMQSNIDYLMLLNDPDSATETTE